MRKLCIECARKHIGQASVLAGEVKKGYPEHKVLAVGHLAEAEDELLNAETSEVKAQVEAIRTVRREYDSDDDNDLDIKKLLEIATTLQKHRDEEECDNCDEY